MSFRARQLVVKVMLLAPQIRTLQIQLEGYPDISEDCKQELRIASNWLDQAAARLLKDRGNI